jgi:LysM repeat protein
LEAIKQASGRDLFQEAVKAKKDFRMLDKVSGGDAMRRALLAGHSAAQIVNSWKPGEAAFRKQREKYLLYPEARPPAPGLAGEPKPAPTLEAQAKMAPTPASSPSPTSPAPLVIRVTRGDTAEKIARDFGITVSDLSMANPGAHLDRIKAGQSLNIPRRKRN